MENPLVEMMSKFIDPTDAEKQGILDAFPIKTFPKDSFLLKEGQISTDSFVVIKGLVRKYYLQDGEEITSEFYTESQTAADLDSLGNQKASKYYLACSEETTVAIMNSEKEKALFNKYPRFKELCLAEMEKLLGTMKEEHQVFKNASPKERYLNLINERPDLINRVPQYQLASYLGIKPETLSRIRKRISNND